MNTFQQIYHQKSLWALSLEMSILNIPLFLCALIAIY